MGSNPTLSANLLFPPREQTGLVPPSPTLSTCYLYCDCDAMRHRPQRALADARLEVALNVLGIAECSSELARLPRPVPA